jgi:primosomal protein N' (replication factor Y)
LTFHETSSRLVCHHCGAEREVPPACPECGSVYLRQFGAGTQRVESELGSRFPGLPVVRMDADTTSRKGGHEARLAEFEALDSGVLVGTQMIAKGLDYPEVTLVGVLGADLGLRLPDFRAGERTYQLLAQVAGRAGRGELPGRVVVQTYWPEHSAIQAAASHDPEHFYSSERELREDLGYPPYSALARLLVTGKSKDDVTRTARSAASSLRSHVSDDVTVLGPSPAALERIRGTHRWHILLKSSSAENLASILRHALSRLDVPDGVKAIPDVDPYDLL